MHSGSGFINIALVVCFLAVVLFLDVSLILIARIVLLNFSYRYLRFGQLGWPREKRELMYFCFVTKVFFDGLNRTFVWLVIRKMKGKHWLFSQPLFMIYFSLSQNLVEGITLPLFTIKQELKCVVMWLCLFFM